MYIYGRKKPSRVAHTPTRWSGRPYIALAPSDDAFRRSGSAGEGSLLASLSRYARGDINRNRNARRLASRGGGHDAGMQWSGPWCSLTPDRAFDDMIWLPADGRSGHIQPSLSESNVDAAASWVVSASTRCTYRRWLARQLVAVSRADQWTLSRRLPRRLRQTEGQPGRRGLAG